MPHIHQHHTIYFPVRVVRWMEKNVRPSLSEMCTTALQNLGKMVHICTLAALKWEQMSAWFATKNSMAVFQVSYILSFFIITARAHCAIFLFDLRRHSSWKVSLADPTQNIIFWSNFPADVEIDYAGGKIHPLTMTLRQDLHIARSSLPPSQGSCAAFGGAGAPSLLRGPGEDNTMISVRLLKRRALEVIIHLFLSQDV